jgi:hypothetical protein
MNLRASVIRRPPRYSIILWVFAAIVANVALPRTLARAARSAAVRDEEDCHQHDAHPAAASTTAAMAQSSGWSGWQ